MQVLRDEILARAVADAPGEGVGVPLRGRRVRERARVLVDAERERGRLEHGGLDLALGEDADECRRERPVGGDHGSAWTHPLRDDVGVMVEEGLLDRGIERDRFELSEARGVRRLHDDESPDRVELETARLDGAAELVSVQAIEVADVSVQAPERHDRARVEAARGEHRRERVEIGVPVGGDDLLGPHGPILPRIVRFGSPRAAAATAR